MAKLITKFKYLKPNARQSVGGYAKYIATREGVEKIDKSFNFAPSSVKQKNLIQKILKDFPDSQTGLEYEDYIKNPTVCNASEFITRALEDNAYEVMQIKTYADYIATRPRAERFGTHGLFTDDGVQVKLNEVSGNLNQYGGNVWTIIISLRREDAERLGFNTGERWRDMLRSQTSLISENFHIPMKNLKWYAAFHNESHHPHVHLMVCSTEEKQAYLSKQGVMNLRSAFAKDIFAQDLLCVYEKQIKQRDELKTNSKELIAEIVSKINSGAYDNPKLEEMLLSLADRLSKTSGKKVYGYLKADVKATIDSIVDEIASDERVSELYDLWYEQREAVIQTYTDELPERVPLSQNKEFKSIKNAIIQEAMNIVTDRLFVETDENSDEQGDLDFESSAEEIEHLFSANKEKTSMMWQFYCKAKEYLNKENKLYNPNKAVELLIESANLGYDVAEYQLGKLYLYGEEVDRDYDKAIAYFTASAEHGNQYAKQLLHSVKSKRNWSATIGSLNLLCQIGHIIQNQVENEYKGKQVSVDRKLRRIIKDKKQAHGLKQ